MATTQTKTRAKSTKRTAEATRTQAKRTGAQAKTTAAQAERTLQGALRDAGYATLGAGDAAVEFARTIGKNLPKAVRPEALASFFEAAAANVREGFDDLSDRGRKVSGSIRRDPKLKEASKQADTAKSRVKAAATSTAKAADAQTDAVGSAARKVGSKPRSTSARKPSTATRTSSSATSDTGTGPLEDRTVDELYARATELDIEGRSSMSKDDLVKAIRDKS